MYKIQAGMESRKRALVRDGRTVAVSTPEVVASECADMAQSAQEMFVVLTLNTKNKLMDKHIVSIGLADASLVHPREIFRKAISDNSQAVILAHNHPSGDTTPSCEDIRITRQMVEAGKIIDIKVLDHVILGVNDVTGGVVHQSLRESGLVEF